MTKRNTLYALITSLPLVLNGCGDNNNNHPTYQDPTYQDNRDNISYLEQVEVGNVDYWHIVAKEIEEGDIEQEKGIKALETGLEKKINQHNSLCGNQNITKVARKANCNLVKRYENALKEVRKYHKDGEFKFNGYQFER